MVNKIKVKVKTNAKQEKIEKINANSFIVWTKEPAKEEKANKAVIKTLSKFLKVPPPSQITLYIGRHSKEKIFDIK